MNQAPKPPSTDELRELVRTLLPSESESGSGSGSGSASGDGPPGEPDVRPVVDEKTPEPERAHSTWWVGDRHVLRLAHDREQSARRLRELRLRDLVRPHVGVPVPVSRGHGEWSPGLVYTLDTRIPGGAGARHKVTALGEADLAGLLTGLHAVPLRQAETAGVPVAAPRSLETLRQSARRAAQELVAADEIDAAWLRPLSEAGAAQLEVRPGTAVLVHRALSAEHLVISEDGRVRGVLDWTDAVLGDPAEDIAGLARAIGSPAAVRAATLAGYGPRPCLRGLWLARCDAILRLAALLRRFGAAESERHTLLRTELTQAWEPILLERVSDLRDESY
ncbi:phosphotransferase [Streptomyces abyssomicinicus]|uniref:phosphotransferase n=1 Tax=Streptomyces abyssomicinicus TaxID=574929 RepID=UPI001250992E|nr:phosphotransferase [Streptomyces abyssomicinicus]